MAYITVPKDLNAVKTKVLFNLTKRQLICFGAGGAVGLPVFFLSRLVLGNAMALFLMVLILIPFLLLAMYERNGQPFEACVRNVLNVTLLRPKVRPYRTNNYYDLLQRQDKLYQEVLEIVQGKTHPSPKEGD